MHGGYSVEAESASSPSFLWALLLDARTWPAWGTVDELVLDRSENLSPDGRDDVGAIRAFRTGKVITGERIVGLVPLERFTYEDAFNPVLRNYRAEVRLSARAGAGTQLRWSGEYETGFGRYFVLNPFMRITMKRMVRGLANARDPRA